MIARRPILYLAGPYTRPDPVENTHMACQVATALYELTAWVPFVPHVTLMWHAITPRPPVFWYDLDLHHMAACDAVVRMPGVSTGADRELDVASKIGLRVIAWESLPDEVRSHWTLA